MERAVITIHLPRHRHAALALQGETREAAEAYDANIGRYVDFLRDEARDAGYRILTDQRELDPVFTIDEQSHDDKKAARAWLEREPDIWEWLT